jgi:hypothetical protein
MDDIPNITPTKPLWPIRPEDKQPKREQDRDGEQGGTQENTDEQDDTPTGSSDHDGQIDEYV